MRSVAFILRSHLRRIIFLRKLVRGSVFLWHKTNFLILDVTLPILSIIIIKTGVPWFSILELRAHMYFRQFKSILIAGTNDVAKTKKFCDRAIDFIEYVISINPDFFYGARIALSINVILGNIPETKRWLEKYYLLKHDLACKRQIDLLGISFVDASPLMQTIGATSIYNSRIKVSILGLGPPTQLVMLVKGGDYSQFVNSHLLNYWRKYICIIDDSDMVCALEPLAEILTASDFEPIEINGKLTFSHCALTWAQHFWDEERRPPLFTLTQEDRERGAEELAKLGVPQDAWFACLHVREGGARQNEPFRQSPISNYFKSIKAVTDRGGWVIRLGDSSMLPLPEMERVVDYPHTSSKSDFMDVYLCGANKFFIGTSSGMWTVAAMFGTPIIHTNYLPTSAVCPSNQDLFIPKLLKHNKNNDPLTFQELFSPPICSGGSDFFYNYIADVTPIDNTPEEIESLVLEMMDRLDGKQTYTSKEEALQSQFKQMTADMEVLPGLPGVPLNARMGQYFLNKYQHLMTGQAALEKTGMD